MAYTRNSTRIRGLSPYHFMRLVVRRDPTRNIFNRDDLFRAAQLDEARSVRGVSQYFPFNKTGKYIGTFSIRFNELSRQTCTAARGDRALHIS